MNGYLGAIELIAYPATIIWMVIALFRNDASLKWATVAVAVLALTIAQPWGATATPISESQRRADGGTRVSTREMHTLKVGPVPVAWFSLFNLSVFGGLESSPTSSTHVRTWFGPMTNGTGLGAARDDYLEGVTLWRTPGGGYDLRENRNGNRGPVTAERASGGAWDGQPLFQDYRIGFGIASDSGVIYWLFAVPAIALGIRLLRRRANATVPDADGVLIDPA